MSNTQLNSFKAQLKKIKRETGLNIDEDAIIESLNQPQKMEPKFDIQALILARIKIDSIIKDYEDFFGPQGKGLEVNIKITKENPGDTVGEQWVMGEEGKIIVRRFEEIGTKGKHEPFRPIHSEVREEDV